jgi:hypothetical protein
LRELKQKYDPTRVFKKILDLSPEVNGHSVEFPEVNGHSVELPEVNGHSIELPSLLSQQKS